MIMSLGLHWWFKLAIWPYIFKMVKHTTFDKTLEDLDTYWWYTWYLTWSEAYLRSEKSKGGMAEGSSSLQKFSALSFEF